MKHAIEVLERAAERHDKMAYATMTHWDNSLSDFHRASAVNCRQAIDALKAFKYKLDRPHIRSLTTEEEAAECD